MELVTALKPLDGNKANGCHLGVIREFATLVRLTIDARESQMDILSATGRGAGTNEEIQSVLQMLVLMVTF